MHPPFLTAAVLLCLVLPLTCYSQSTAGGVLKGSVADSSGAAMKNVSIEIANPVSRYDRNIKTDAQGIGGQGRLG